MTTFGRCTSCSWRGLPTREGGVRVGRVRFFFGPGAGRVQRVVGSRPSNRCPACRRETVVPTFKAAA